MAFYTFEQERTYDQGYVQDKYLSTDAFSETGSTGDTTFTGGPTSYTDHATNLTNETHHHVLSVDGLNFTSIDETTHSEHASWQGTSDDGVTPTTTNGTSDYVYSLGFTTEFHQDGTNFTSARYDTNGLLESITGTTGAFTHRIPEDSTKEFYAAGATEGDTRTIDTTLESPVTIQSVSWSINERGKPESFTYATTILGTTTAQLSFVDFDYETTSFESTFMGETGEATALPSNVNYLEAISMRPQERPFGVVAERGLMAVFFPFDAGIGQRFYEDPLAALDWSYPGAMDVVTENSSWKAFALVTLELGQGTYNSVVNDAISLELRKETSLTYHVPDGEGGLSIATVEIAGVTFEATGYYGLAYATYPELTLLLTTCEGVFITYEDSEAGTNGTRLGVSTRSVWGTSMAYSLATDTIVPVYSVEGTTTEEASVAGLVVQRHTVESRQLGGNASPMEFVEMREIGVGSDSPSLPVLFYCQPVGGYVEFDAGVTHDLELFHSRSFRSVSVEGDTGTTFDLSRLAPCTDNFGQHGRTRLDPPCRCSETIITMEGTATATVPSWSVETTELSRVGWSMEDGEPVSYESTYQGTEGYTEGDPLTITLTDTITLYRGWIAGGNNHEASFTYLLEFPSLVAQKGTVEVFLLYPKDPRGMLWESTHAQEGLIMGARDEQAFLTWAGLALELILVDSTGGTTSTALTHAGDGQASFALEGRNAYMQTCPMLTPMPGSGKYSRTMQTMAPAWDFLGYVDNG